MTLISLDEAKTYLRVDSADEDAVISSLLLASIRDCHRSGGPRSMVVPALLRHFLMRS